MEEFQLLKLEFGWKICWKNVYERVVFFKVESAFILSWEWELTNFYSTLKLKVLQSCVEMKKFEKKILEMNSTFSLKLDLAYFAIFQDFL